MLPLEQLTFQKRMKQLLCLEKRREEEREAVVSGTDFSANSECSETAASLTPLAASRNRFIYISGAALGLKVFHCLADVVFS